MARKRITIMDVLAKSERRINFLVNLAWYVIMLTLGFFAFLMYLVVTN